MRLGDFLDDDVAASPEARWLRHLAHEMIGVVWCAAVMLDGGLLALWIVGLTGGAYLAAQVIQFSRASDRRRSAWDAALDGAMIAAGAGVLVAGLHGWALAAGLAWGVGALALRRYEHGRQSKPFG